jgi:uncharacterized membrane protein YkvI
VHKGWFGRLILPGLVFQSVVIAGGYGTGREIVEFFLTLGPARGLLAMLVSTIVWSAVCAASFEFARRFDRFDYRSFFRELLGPAWWLFEVCYLAQLGLVLAVIAAAAGSMLQQTFQLPYALGVGGIMLAVGWLVFAGSRAIERALATWSLVLYATYAVFFTWSLSRSGGFSLTPAAETADAGSWIIGGLRYAAYNLAVIPAVLFVLRHARSRRDALTAGILAGPIGIVPGFLFYLTMLPHYPAIVESTAPAALLLERLDSRVFTVFFQVVLFGTLIETGTGMIHAVNERIANVFTEHGRSMPRGLRPATATVLLLAAVGLASFGLVALIAKGYGTLTWLFLVVFVIPVLTWGTLKLRRAGPNAVST